MSHAIGNWEAIHIAKLVHGNIILAADKTPHIQISNAILDKLCCLSNDAVLLSTSNCKSSQSSSDK